MKTRYRVEFLYDVPDAANLELPGVLDLIARALRNELLLWSDYAYRDLYITRQGRIRDRTATQKRKAAQSDRTGSAP